MLPDNNGYTIQVQNPKVFFTPEVRFFVVRFHDYGLLQEDFRGNYRHYSRCNAAVGGLYSRVCAERFPFGKQEAHGPHRSPEKTVQINKHI